MPIVLDAPISVPAKEFDIVWIQSVFIDGNNPNMVVANYTLRPARQVEGGGYELGPGGVKGRIDNIMNVAMARAVAGKPKLAMAMQGVMDALEEIEKEKGTI